MVNSEQTGNHRGRVAAERRERTRARLLESALLVFAEKGPEAAVIDDVIAIAGMARGSFYNYFRTNEELLAAVAAEINDELLRVIDPVVQPHEDPAARIACGTRLLLHTMRRYPLLSAFFLRLPWAAKSQLIGIAFLVRDLEMGIDQKKFSHFPLRAAVDLVAGAMFSAAQSFSRETLPDDYPEALVKAILLGLGVSKRDAARCTALPLPDIDLDDKGILKRTLERSRSGARTPI
jgi:AcrR family transcriptional regulator